MDPNRTSDNETLERLTRGAVDVLPQGEIAEKVKLAASEKRPLRVKLGIDPTAPDIHLGHTVVLNKLRQFQDAGHTVVLIIGDYTARVGDPSGRSATRPVLSGAEIDANAETFQEQAFKVLDADRVEVRRNSEWLAMEMEELFKLVRTTTVGQLLVRDDFSKRYAANEPISVLELLYPLLQAYDSVAINSDIELGGTDQKFNLLLGRDIQRAYGQPEQAVLTMPILPGTDGVRRMSKSLGNYIGVTEPPADIYGKTLSIPDEALETYYELLFAQAVPEGGPRDAKRQLARQLVTRFYDEAAAKEAEGEFDRIHIERGVPDEMPTVAFAAADGQVHLPALIAENFGGSRSEARRLIAQGAVKLNGDTLSDTDTDIDAQRLEGATFQVGKRKFAKLTGE